MAWEKDLVICGQFTAASDLSTKKYHFVFMSGLAIEACTTGTQRPLGILQNTPSASQPAEVATDGFSKIILSAAQTAGDLVGAAAAGGASGKTVGTESGHYIGGMIVEGGGAGAYATVKLAGVPFRAA